MDSKESIFFVILNHRTHVRIDSRGCYGLEKEFIHRMAITAI